MSEILVHTPHIKRKRGELAALAAGTSTLRRYLRRRWEQKMEDHGRRNSCLITPSPGAGTAPSMEFQPNSFTARARMPSRSASTSFVPWKEISHTLRQPPGEFDTPSSWHRNAECLGLLQPSGKHGETTIEAMAPTTTVLATFVDRHLTLQRPPRQPERQALWKALDSWSANGRFIKLSGLGNARAFLTLLKMMNFREAEIELELTSQKAHGMTSAAIHDFLSDRQKHPRLSGRRGWRGSVIVKLRPTGSIGPTVATRVCRFALSVLAVHYGDGSASAFPKTLQE